MSGLASIPNPAGDFQFPGGDTLDTRMPPLRDLNVKGMQRHLVNQGYGIRVSGKLDPITKRALADYLQPSRSNLAPNLVAALKGTAITGARDPSAFNMRFGLSRTTKKVERPLTGAGGQLDEAGNIVTNVPAQTQVPPGVPAEGAGLPAIDLSGLALDPAVNRILPIALAQGGARLLPRGTADDIAGLQYDPIIQDLLVERARAPRDTRQAIGDIGNWYDQVLGSQRTAATRDAAIGRAAKASIGDATEDIVSALGGRANAGSALVGAAGADAVGTLSALGVAQDQYNQDIAPLLRAEGAAARERERSAGTSRLHDLALKIAQAKGQRGQAEGAAGLQIQEANNRILDTRLGRELEIRQANNASRQANFGNRFGLGTAQITAAINGINAITKAVTADTKAAAAGKGKRSSKFVPYRRASDSTKTAAGQDIIGLIEGQKLTPEQALAAASKVIVNGYGWSMQNPGVQGLVRAAIRAAGFNI